MSGYAAGYLRRSGDKADDDDPVDGYANQWATIGQLAALYAPDAPLQRYQDEAISGAKKERKDYVRLKREIEAGMVCCVFAYSMSRLGRDTRELLDFFELCKAASVTVYTKVEGPLGVDSPHGMFLLTILAGVAKLESDLGKERTKWARDARTARYAASDLSVPPSRPGFGRRKQTRADNLVELVDDPEQYAPVLLAYEDSGRNLRATCQLLKERGVPAPDGGASWGLSTTRRILIAHGDYQPTINAAGTHRPMTNTKAAYAGLLLCRCGRTLTPNTVRGQYYCAKGLADGLADHGRYTVTERALRTILEPIAATVITQAHIDLTEQGQEDSAARKALAAKIARLDVRYEMNSIDESTFRREVAKVKAHIEKLSRTEQSVRVLQLRTDPEPPAYPEPGEDASAYNAWLRTIWASVKLRGPDLLPAAGDIDWLIPEWMHDDAAYEARTAELEG